MNLSNWCTPVALCGKPEVSFIKGSRDTLCSFSEMDKDGQCINKGEGCKCYSLPALADQVDRQVEKAMVDIELTTRELLKHTCEFPQLATLCKLMRHEAIFIRKQMYVMSRCSKTAEGAVDTGAESLNRYMEGLWQAVSLSMCEMKIPHDTMAVVQGHFEEFTRNPYKEGNRHDL